MMTKMAKESKNGRVKTVLPTPPAAQRAEMDRAMLKSSERKI